MTKINTVLFDFDGTIMDTNDVILQSFQYAFRTLEGKERSAEEIISTFGEPLHTTMKRALPQIPVEQAVEIYRSFHHEHFEELIEIFPGVLELIKKLKAMGYKLGIVTNRLHHTTDLGLKKYDMERYFDVVVTVEDTGKNKPDAEPVLFALEQLGSTPEETIMVGDSKHDMECARNAGLRAAVLVSWALAFSDEDKTGENAPDHILEKAEDLLALLEQ